MNGAFGTQGEQAPNDTVQGRPRGGIEATLIRHAENYPDRYTAIMERIVLETLEFRRKYPGDD